MTNQEPAPFRRLPNSFIQITDSAAIRRSERTQEEIDSAEKAARLFVRKRFINKLCFWRAWKLWERAKQAWTPRFVTRYLIRREHKKWTGHYPYQPQHLVTVVKVNSDV